MAITATASTGFAGNQSAGASLAVTVAGGNIAPGDVIVVGIAADNAGTSGVSSVTAPTDSQGHTYSLVKEQNRTAASAANDGTTASIYATRCTKAMVSGTDTITGNFSPNTTAKVVAYQVFRGVEEIAYSTNGVGNSGSAYNGGNLATASLASGDLVVVVVASESATLPQTDTDTTNGSWVSSQRQTGGGTGGDATKQSINLFYKIVTGTGTQTASGTTAATDNAVAWGLFTVPVAKSAVENGTVSPVARTFASASSEKIDLALGAGASVTGAVTFAAILKRGTDAVSQTVLALGSTITTQRSLNIGSSNKPFLRSNNSTAAGANTITVVAADGWVLLAVTKAAGTATPRYHKYVFSTATWTHEDSLSTVGDSTPSGASGIGYRVDSAVAFFNGDIAIEGSWTSALTDNQVEALAGSFGAWSTVTPNGLWILNQGSVTEPVRDASGGGANQSAIVGTTIATSAPPLGGETEGVNTGAQPSDDDPATGTDGGENVAQSFFDDDPASGDDAGTVAASLGDLDGAGITGLLTLAAVGGASGGFGNTGSTTIGGGGSSGLSSSGGSGGTATAGAGTRGGAGGGGSGGQGGNGFPGVDATTTGGTGGTAGAAGVGSPGATGGGGGTGNNGGTVGGTPGAGGGGGGSAGGSTVGGDGAAGRVVLTFQGGSPITFDGPPPGNGVAVSQIVAPVGASSVLVEAWGAGGGGGAGNLNGANGGGGGGGAGGHSAVSLSLDKTGTQRLIVQVAGGGKGGVTGTDSGNGWNGGATSAGGGGQATNVQYVAFTLQQDSQSVAASVTAPTDTATGVDAGESIAAGLTDTDAGTETDSESLDTGGGGPTPVSDGDTASGTEGAEQVAAALTDAETPSTGDSETISAGTSDAEVGTAVDTEGAAAVVVDPDTGATLDVEAVAAAVSDAETGSSVDVEALVVLVVEGDTATAADVVAVLSAVVADTDTATALEAWLVSAALSDDDVAALSDDEVLGAAVVDADFAVAIDDAFPPVVVFAHLFGGVTVALLPAAGVDVALGRAAGTTIGLRSEIGGVSTSTSPGDPGIVTNRRPGGGFTVS